MRGQGNFNKSNIVVKSLCNNIDIIENSVVGKIHILPEFNILKTHKVPKYGKKCSFFVLLKFDTKG